MSYRVRPDPVSGKRMTTAAGLFAAAMLCVGGSLAWTIVSGPDQPGSKEAGGPQSVAVCFSLLLLFIAIPLVFIAHARVTWRYRCPQCGTRIRANIPTEAGAPIRHRCQRCRTDWDTGWHVATGGD